MTYLSDDERPNNPTVDTCCNLCRLAGYNANWLFLGMGKIELEEQTSLDKLLKEIRSLKKQFAE